MEEARPLGNTLFNARTEDDLPVNVALFGVEPSSFVAPSVTHGAPLGSAPDGVVIADTLADQGIEIGDTIRLDVVGTTLTVIGVAPTGTYGHVPVVTRRRPLAEASFAHHERATLLAVLRLADDADAARLVPHQSHRHPQIRTIPPGSPGRCGYAVIKRPYCLNTVPCARGRMVLQLAGRAQGESGTTLAAASEALGQAVHHQRHRRHQAAPGWLARLRTWFRLGAAVLSSIGLLIPLG